MRVLITGASGYLGGHIVEHLLKEGHTVRALCRSENHLSWLKAKAVETVQGDLSDYARLRSACSGMQGVVHAAAITGSWSRINEAQRLINVEGTATLLRAAYRARVSRIVHVSSIVAVGCTRDAKVLDESFAWTGAGQPSIHYVQTKRESEERVFAATRGGVPALIVNPAAMIGPYAQDGRVRGHVGSILGGQHGRVPSGGSSIAHVSDVAQGVVAGLQQGRTGERYILGGENMSWQILREVIGRLAQVNAPVRLERMRLLPLLLAGAQFLDLLRLSKPTSTADRYRLWGWYSYGCSDKARRELSYAPRTVEQAIQETLASQ
jgi:dihydroflavonol-4-reductase